MKHTACIVALVLLAGCRGGESNHSSDVHGHDNQSHESVDINPVSPGGAASNDRQPLQETRIQVEIIQAHQSKELIKPPRHEPSLDEERPDINPERPGGAPE